MKSDEIMMELPEEEEEVGEEVGREEKEKRWKR